MYHTRETAEATPHATTCTYDSGAMTDCAPACDRPATHRLLYSVACYGWSAADLCARHVMPMQGRIYPSCGFVKEIER